MILVDDLREHGTLLRNKWWAHMVSTENEEELHTFAAKLGLKREWAQLRPKASAAHYDLTSSKRTLAIMLGATPVKSRELVRRNFDGLQRRLLEATKHDFIYDSNTTQCERCGLARHLHKKAS